MTDEPATTPPPSASSAPGAPGTSAALRVRGLWDRARLVIAFHRERGEGRRRWPVIWQPRDATATLRPDPKDAEAFVQLRGADGPEDDVQLKLHRDKIIARRPAGAGWAGVQIDPHKVAVLVNGLWIEIAHDGAVTRHAADGTTFLEGDGSIIRFSDDDQVCVEVSADNAEISRRGPDKLDVIRRDGVISRKR